MTRRRVNRQSEKIKNLDPERRRKATFKTKKKEEEKVKIQRILRYMFLYKFISPTDIFNNPDL